MSGVNDWYCMGLSRSSRPGQTPQDQKHIEGMINTLAKKGSAVLTDEQYKTFVAKVLKSPWPRSVRLLDLWKTTRNVPENVIQTVLARAEDLPSGLICPCKPSPDSDKFRGDCARKFAFITMISCALALELVHIGLKCPTSPTSQIHMAWCWLESSSSPMNWEQWCDGASAKQLEMAIPAGTWMPKNTHLLRQHVANL
jgi:hypothetical protein